MVEQAKEGGWRKNVKLPSKEKWLSSLVTVFLVGCIFLAAEVKAAPQSYITEEIQANYFFNGSLSGPITRAGYVEVSVGNTVDALQQVRLTLSSTAETNLRSTTAYRNVAASPNLPSDRTLIFLNTTNSTQDLSYKITNQSLMPVIAMKMDYMNQKGGMDITPGTNNFIFNLTLNASKSLTVASLVIQAKRNTFGVNDSINFISAYAQSGLTQLLDTDSDGFNDRVLWTGNLPQGDFNVSFIGTITPGVNFDESFMQVSMDESQTYCSYSGAGTFTGITFSSRLSKGPIREGIEMIQIGTWTARGFIKNIASNITYILHRWELYQIGNPTPVLSSQPDIYIQPGEIKYTSWYDTGASGKPAYYSASFDWQVVWGTSTTYSSTSRSSMSMPVLQEMDSWADGTAVLQSNTESGRSVRINITTRHLGHSAVPVNSAQINSTLPRFSNDSEAKTWTPSSVRLYYSNGSGTYDITSSASIQTSDSGSGDGYIFASINDIFSAIGHYMGQNDDIILSYIASSPASGSNQNYTFTTNTTLVTLSGTPVTKTIQPSLLIPGVVISVGPGGPGGGGGGGPPPAPYADIVKESADAYFVTANMVNVIVAAGIVDSGDKGIKDIKVLAYAPKDAEIDTTTFSLRLYHSSTKSWEELKLDTDFMVVDRNLTKIGNDEYNEYLVKRTTPGGSISERTIDLKNGDKIEASYKVKVPFGTSYLLTRIFGYSYYEDKLIFEDAYIPVRREIEKIEKLQIDESEWVQENALVGKPVRWTKTFRIYNPNNVSVEETVATGVFHDSMTVEIAEAGKTERTKLGLKGGEEATVNWQARMNALERKTYIMEATTPPILETKREVDIIESNRTTVRIVINLTLENFAKEGYFNVTFPFPVNKNKIILISDPTLILEEAGTGVNILMQRMNGFEVKNISMMYIETPPIMMTTLDALKYSCTGYVNLTIFIVPSETETGSYVETEVVGPEPTLITSHAEVLDLGNARPYQEIKIPIRINLYSFPSGKYFVYTKFRKDFGTILSDTREFFVDCPGREIIQISWIFVLGASIAIVALLVLRVYRKRSYEKELGELKKKVKGI